MINATLIYNPTAGRNRTQRDRQMEQAAAILRQGGVAAALARTSGPGSAQELARRAVAEGCERVLVCGGDGTINEVMNGMVGGAVPLGILPGGTANIIAKELGLAHNPLRAAKQILQSAPRRIPLGWATWGGAGKTEQRYFLSVAGAGLDAQIIRELSLDSKAQLGVAAYFWEALKQISRYSFPQFVCRVNGTQFPATFAVAQRTRRYAGWVRMAPGADFFKPALTACIFRGATKVRWPAYVASALLRRHPKLRDVKVMETASMFCNPANPDSVIYFELDGELAGRLPATFEVVPDALTLLVP